MARTTNYPIEKLFRTSLHDELDHYRKHIEQGDTWCSDPDRLAYLAAEKLQDRWARYIAAHWLEDTDFSRETIEVYRATFALVVRYRAVCQLAYLGKSD
jgi:hypothetical protein